MNIELCQKMWKEIFCFAFFICINGGSSLLCGNQKAVAQVVPDNTLGGEASVVQTMEQFLQEVGGGALRGKNLFHSFQEFNVIEGKQVYFANPAGVENIFSRVTGGNPSKIFGLLGVSGNANLFLINPRGIIFGPNTNLDIKGSFIGTTADNIKFPNGSEFRANLPNQVPSIQIETEPFIGLIFEGNPEKNIIINGSGHDIRYGKIILPSTVENNKSELRVSTGKTLALIGGDINLKGGNLVTEGGQIQLSSIRQGTVNLYPISSGWIFDFSAAQNFGDVKLSSRSSLNASGLKDGSIPGGSVQITGGKVEFKDGSALIIQNFSVFSSGNIKIFASEVVLNGVSFQNNDPRIYTPSIFLSETLGIGKGSNIEVSTSKLSIENGAAISNHTFNSGAGGSITVNASESITISGFSFFNPADSNTLSISGIGSNTGIDSGQGGNITLKTDNLSISNGAAIVAGTYGSGKGGDIFVDARLVDIAGGTFFGAPSQINSANFSAEKNTGVGGNITINTDTLSVKNAGSVSSDTYGDGQAGGVTINAAAKVEISVFGRISSIALVAPEIIRQPLKLPNIVSGNSGNVVVNTKKLTIENITTSNFVNPFNFSGINVSNFGTGNAGTLKINAERIELNRGGTISAITTSGLGGSIEIDAKIMQLRRGSNIATDAGGIGNGGNININSDFITAVPIEDSNISANAFEGDGGKININAKGIFGLEFRKFPTRLSDITASSEFGVQGEVKINSLEFNSLQDAIELPKELVKFFDSVGCASGGSIQFFNIGRGGYLPNPQEPLDNENLIVNWIEPNSTEPIDDSKTKSQENHTFALAEHNAFIPACID